MFLPEERKRLAMVLTPIWALGSWACAQLDKPGFSVVFGSAAVGGGICLVSRFCGAQRRRRQENSAMTPLFSLDAQLARLAPQDSLPQEGAESLNTQP